MTSRKTYLSLLLVSLIVMTIILLEGWNFSYGSLAFVALVTAPLSLVLWILFRFKKITPKIHVWTIGVFVTTILAFLISEPIRRIQKEKSQQEGDKIILALENYYIDNNEYPNELIELEPNYLNEIPQPKTGVFSRKDYFYLRSQTGKYHLGFRYVSIDIGGQIIYESNDNYDYWRYDD